MRITGAFKLFVYVCVGVLFAFLVVVTILNLFIPFAISCLQENFMWLLLYIAEPFLLFADIYVWLLLDDLQWWI